MHSSTSILASLGLLASLVHGHMTMKSPIPYAPAPDSSPLSADGSNFPCKGGSYQVQTENMMAIGEQQTLSFTGSAVHGGGSCQVSLTSDRAPTKNSKWSVIKSIEGGCPSNVTGNLPADPTGSGAAVFDYSIPEGIAPGQYTLAWTWVNKIGNREFYMNCAPVTVTGAKKKRYAPAGTSLVRRQSTFPDMFVANLAGINNCVTTEGVDYHYPDPGPVVQQAGSGPYTQLSCNAYAAGGSGNAPSATATGAPVASSAAVAGESSAPAASSAQPSGFASGGSAPHAPANSPAASQATGGVFATATAPLAGASAPAGTGSPATAASAPAATGVAPLPASTAGASSGSSSSAGAPTAGSDCSPEGQWFCSGTAYMRCASGKWSQSMNLAAGMTCNPGMSTGLWSKRSTKEGWVRRRESFRA